MRVPALIRLALLVLVAGAAVAGCGGDEPPPREVPQYSVEDFLATTSYRGLSSSAGQDRILVSSDASGVFNAYAVPIDGSEPIQLTFSETDAVMARSYFPADDQTGLSSAITEALKIPFTVYDQGGNQVAAGQVNGEPLSLDQGRYRVVVRTSPEQTFDPVDIEGEKAGLLELQ